MATLIMIEVDEFLAAVMLSSKMKAGISIPALSHSDASTGCSPDSTANGEVVPKEADSALTKTTDGEPTISGKEVIPKKKKARPRVLKEEKVGIYTIQHLEAANPVKEWYKGLRITAPYMLRLMKMYWSLSPIRASLLIGTNLLNTVLPSLELWISKSLLDQVQEAVKGTKPNFKELLILSTMAVGMVVLEHGLNVVTYVSLRAWLIIETRLIQS